MLLGCQVQEKPLLIGLQYKGWALLQCFFTPIYCTLKQPTFWLLRIWIWLDYEQERNTRSYCNICNIQCITLVQQLSSREKWRNNDSDIYDKLVTNQSDVSSARCFLDHHPPNDKKKQHTTQNINPCRPARIIHNHPLSIKLETWNKHN